MTQILNSYITLDGADNEAAEGDDEVGVLCSDMYSTNVASLKFAFSTFC